VIVNPFSPEAEKVVKKYQDEGFSSKEVFEYAKKLVGWKAQDSRKKIIPKSLLSGYNIERDILGWRLLYLTVSLNFTPYSNELRLVKECHQALTKARLSSLVGEEIENRVVGLLSDLFDIRLGAPTVEGGIRFGDVFVEKKELYTGPQIRYGEPWRVRYAVDWRELVRIIRARELRFVDLYLVKGLALLSLNDLIDLYSKLIGLKIEDFMTNRFEEFQGMKRSDRIKRLGEETSGLAEYLSTVSGESFRGTVLQGKAGRLRPENFPPCIKYIVAGVETGSRNYAISVLLTSFLSYARAAPGKVQEPKISDYVKDPKILSDELLPMIYGAATRCQPPLFEDQPGEKLNIHYHLGLGLSSTVKLESAGSSRWYFPPNCEKIRRESPSLCRPDETCKQIKNPLTYYFVKFKKKEEVAEEKPS
jgi:DNA primase large subunit